MKATEKAYQIYWHYYQLVADSCCPEDNAKQLSLYLIDEVSNVLCSDRITYGSEYRYEESEFWNEVKSELEKL